MGAPTTKRDPKVDVSELLLGPDLPTLRIGSVPKPLAGGKDPEFPPAITETMGRGLPNARVVVFPGMAHGFPGSLMRDHIARSCSRRTHSPLDRPRRDRKRTYAILGPTHGGGHA